MRQPDFSLSPIGPAVRVVRDCPIQPDGTFAIPKGNIIGQIFVSLPDALQGTVQSSLIEFRASLVFDGTPVPLTVKVEDFHFDPTKD